MSKGEARKRGRTFGGLGARAVLGVLAGLLSLAAGQAAHSADEGPSSPEVWLDARARASHHGRYRVAVLAGVETAAVDRDGALILRMLILRISTADGETVDNATVAASSWMPDESRVAARDARVHAGPSAGTYLLGDLGLDRPGWWNVKLAIDASAGIDSLAFNLILGTSPRRESTMGTKRRPRSSDAPEPGRPGVP